MTLSLEVRKRVLQCYITPILTYGCESWKINKQESGKLEAIVMWFYRRMLRISWTARKTNVEVLKESTAKRSLICFGHVETRRFGEYSYSRKD